MDHMKSSTCKVCGQYKDYMDMNTDILCKDCWVKREVDKYNIAARRTVIMRRKLYGEKYHK